MAGPPGTGSLGATERPGKASRRRGPELKPGTGTHGLKQTASSLEMSSLPEVGLATLQTQPVRHSSVLTPWDGAGREAAHLEDGDGIGVREAAQED